MTMPTADNNGVLIVQSPGCVVMHHEMIHTARIIPLDGRPHLEPTIRLWEGDPRGHWEGDTLVIESTNFKAVENMRSPNGRAPQSEKRRIVERASRSWMLTPSSTRRPWMTRRHIPRRRRSTGPSLSDESMGPGDVSWGRLSVESPPVAGRSGNRRSRRPA
jgi:hypothetical protein